MLENMYHNMTYEELARETRRSDDKCDETLEIERSGFENLKTDTAMKKPILISFSGGRTSAYLTYL